MKLLKLSLITSFLLVILPTLNAQECGTDIKRQELLQDPNFVEFEKSTEKKIQDVIKNKDLSKMAGSVLTIPMVIHVLHLGEAEGTGSNISDAQIQSSIDNLNDYYRGQIATSPVDFEIEFALAQRDPNCNATNGVNRIDASSLPGYSNFGVNVNNTNGANYSDIVALSSWSPNDYFNVWIVTELDDNNGGSGFQGYAYYYFDNANFHGSVMMSTVFGYDPGNTNGWGLNSNGDNSTVVHEAGHYFNLHHTFIGDNGGADCPADQTTTGQFADSDGCADTVPHRRETSTCPAINSCTGNPWVDNNTINNIMSYYSCADRLTNDQRTRARAFMEGTQIVSSDGAVPINSNYVAPSNVCSTNVASSTASGILSVELNGVSKNSSSSSNDGGNIDNTSCSSYFEIDTAVTNTLYVDVYSINDQQLGVWIDWNNDGDFNDDAEMQHFSQDIPENSTVAIPLTYPTLIPYDNFVRIRLITDVDDIYGVGLINSPCYQSIVYGQSEDYVIYVQPGGSTTYTYNNGWSPSNPIGVSTINDDIIVESGTVTIPSNTDCNTLTVDPGGAVSIASGVTLNTTTVDLNSTSLLFSSLISDGTITGTVNYNRYVSMIGSSNTSGGNDLISIPVMPVTGVSFEELTLQGSPANNTKIAMNPAQTLFAFGPYDNTSNLQFINYETFNENEPPSPGLPVSMVKGKGYRAATSIGEALTFSGAVETGTVNIGVNTPSGGSQWNLIGNPYPSYIDASSFITSTANNTVLDGAGTAIYAYNSNTYFGSAQTTGSYTIINLATLSLPGETFNIAPGQGFFVASGTGGNVEFTPNMRTNIGNDDYIVGRNSDESKLLKLDLIGSSTYSTSIIFNSNASLGLDQGYDAVVFGGNQNSYPLYSHLVQDNMGLAMAIQAVEKNDFVDLTIPLGINSNQGEQITFSINTSTLPSTTEVYLDDTVANVTTLLTSGDYTLTPSTHLNGVGRFYLHVVDSALSTHENALDNLSIYSNQNDKTVVIAGQLMENTTVKIYDIQGRVVIESLLESSKRLQTINVRNLNTGVYIVQLINTAQKKNQKLIIRQN